MSGRRQQRAEIEACGHIVTSWTKRSGREVKVLAGVVQNRHTRRNNLRVAYAENRRAAKIERLAKAGRHDDLRALKPTPDEWKRVRELRGAA